MKSRTVIFNLLCCSDKCRGGRNNRPKILASQLKDNWMMLKFGVAKELGKTLHEIGEMTEQELIGWSAYFQVLNEEQEKEFEKIRRRR
ncbi:MAG: hypothetical protein CM15mV70_540 [Caudoviricetes sp.]|nr:MAG: hypothetical protein CM15mV70_540 [Caudoviricetes sp.]